MDLEVWDAMLATEIRSLELILLPSLSQEVRTVSGVSASGTSSNTQMRLNTVPEYSEVEERSTTDNSRPVKLIVGAGTGRKATGGQVISGTNFPLHLKKLTCYSDSLHC